MFSKKRTIAVDFDDVLIDFFPSMIDFYNIKENRSIKKEDINSFFMDKLWDCTEEEAKNKILNFYDLERNFDLKPIKGSVEAIFKLKEKNNLIIITGRPSYTLEFIKDWLEKNIPGVFENIFFTDFFFGGKKTKAQICSEVGAEIMIDDSPIFLQDALDYEIKVLLLDSPWNQGELPSNITRVFSWKEILTHLDN